MSKAIDILKRRNATSACDPCRRLKTRCDNEAPCSNCKRFERVCIYSPQKKRGPAAKVTYGIEVRLTSEKFQTTMEDVETKSMKKQEFTAVTEYLNILLSTFARKTSTKVISMEGFCEEKSSAILKLQLFSALSLTCRACGDKLFAESMLELAEEVAYEKIIHFVNDELEDLAVGFFLLATSMTTIDRRKSKYYCDIAKAMVDLFHNEGGFNPALSGMITTISFFLEPFHSEYLIDNSSFDSHMPNLHYGTLTSLTPDAFQVMKNIFSKSNPTQEYLEREINAALSKRFSISIDMALITLAILKSFCPSFVASFENQHILPENLSIAEGSVPYQLCVNLVTILQIITKPLKLPEAAIPIGFILTMKCFLFASLGDYESAKLCAIRYLDCLETQAFFTLMLSPTYISCPCLILILGFFIRMNMRKEATECYQSLKRYVNSDYTIAKTALPIFEPYFQEFSFNPQFFEPANQTTYYPERMGWNYDKDLLLSFELEQILAAV